MSDDNLPPHELAFAELVWEHQPINSGELVKLAERNLGWKKSTTYTVLKKLCDKGIVVNYDSTVSSAITRVEFAARRSQRLVDEVFDGSLPRFVAAFIDHRRLNDDQVAQLQRLIADYRG